MLCCFVNFLGVILVCMITVVDFGWTFVCFLPGFLMIFKCRCNPQSCSAQAIFEKIKNAEWQKEVRQRRIVVRIHTTWHGCSSFKCWPKAFEAFVRNNGVLQQLRFIQIFAVPPLVKEFWQS